MLSADRPPFDPLRDRLGAVGRLLAAREAGLSLRKGAAAAGVHVATACRWAASSPELQDALDAAAKAARHRRFAAMPPYRPRTPEDVPVHPECPRCEAAVVVRRSRSGRLFWWACAKCPWESWRPRHPEDCEACGGPRYRSCSRKSVSCPRRRVRATPGGTPRGAR
jgi:hypothetical protein